MAKSKNQHVVTHYGAWAVRAEDAQKVTKIFGTKQDAVDYGRQIARHQRTELVVHGKNGQIQNKDSHGRDPFPPRDKR